jgi:hypothetical protein
MTNRKLSHQAEMRHNDKTCAPWEIGRFAIAIAFAIVAASPVHAQMAPPMDMSWALRSQQQAWNIGQANANRTAMAYYQYMQRLRAQGYTGPSLPTGVTPESLQRSINAANKAGQDYNAAQFNNAQRRFNTATDYDLRAIRGCSRYVSPSGQVFYYGC